MKYWLVVYIMINGAWIPGEQLEGWGPMAYESHERCLKNKARAEALQAELRAKNPRAHDKRFVCESRRSGSRD